MPLFRRPRRLITKIWSYLLLPTLFVLLLISIASTLYFNSFSLKRAVDNASAETEHTASRFRDTYNYIINRFISLTVSESMKKNIREILSINNSSYAEYNNILQEEINGYIQIHELITSVLLARRNDDGTLYLFYPYSFHLKNNIDYDLGYDLSSLDGIAFLPASQGPYARQDETLPMVIPLKYDIEKNFLLISSNMTETDILFYIFFDMDTLGTFLDAYCNDTSEGILYLTDSTGSPLSLERDTDDYANIQANDINVTASAMIAGQTSYTNINNYHIFCAPVLEGTLYLFNVVPEGQFMQEYSQIRSILLTIATTAFISVGILSVMLSLFITRPLKRLMESLHSIETDNYRGKIKISSNDEIEQLNNSIDSMYRTIQRQICRIQQEENEKYNTQLQLLSEQINPHFLYNALEFINMEVINRRNDNASNMISSLGKYLRIGLAYGESLLLLSSEVNHALEYVNIMNYRFSNMIQVAVDIPEMLMKRQILKCILQPLVENSLKHGFRIDSATTFPFSPLITIAATLTTEYMELAVIDNGTGIDISRAEQSIGVQWEVSSKKHVGLNNIYRRLESYYGKVDIKFSSVPFFENKVTIRLPAHFFTDTASKDSAEQEVHEI